MREPMGVLQGETKKTGGAAARLNEHTITIWLFNIAMENHHFK